MTQHFGRDDFRATSPVTRATGSKFVPAQFHGTFRYNIDKVSPGTLKWPIITIANLLLLLKRLQQVSDICCRLLTSICLVLLAFLFQKLRSDPRHSEVGFKVGMVMRHKL